MAIEYLRELTNNPSLTSEEFDESRNQNKQNYVVHFLPGQTINRKKGGTLRLGSYECELKEDSKAFKAYKTKLINERHRHRYEFNSDFKKHFENSEMKISGINPESQLVEIIEAKDHPFYVGCQYHPEFLSRPLKPHPLFEALIKNS